MGSGTSRPAPPSHQGGGLRIISHPWPWTARSPRTPPSRGIKEWEAFSLGAQSPDAERARLPHGRMEARPGIQARRPPWGAGEPIRAPGCHAPRWQTVPRQRRAASRGHLAHARPPLPARSPPQPPGSGRRSRSSCAGSSPASPSAPAAHSAWPRGSASCSCGSSCEVTSWFRDDLGEARFLPPTRPLLSADGGGTETPFALARRL